MQRRILPRFTVSWIVLFSIFCVASGCGLSPSSRAAKHRTRAEALWKEKKYAEASIEYQAALQALPGDTEALYGLARSFDALGEANEYRKTLEKLVKAQPNHPSACVGLGGFFWASGNYRLALEFADRALKGDAASAEARKLRARSLSRLGKKPDARAVWEQILATGAADDSAYVEAADFESWAGDKTQAVSILRRGLERFPGSARLHLAAAAAFLATKDLAAAGPEVDKAIQLDPENPTVYSARAELLIRSGRVNDGLQWLAKAQERFSGSSEKSARMAVLRAQIYTRLGDLATAKQVLQAEREKNPEHAEIAAALADVLINLGQARQALDVLAPARRLDPAARTARLLAAKAYLQTGRPDWAFGILAGLVGKGDLGVDTHYLYAAALAQTNRLAKARQEYLMLLARLPDHHLARVDYARLLLVMREHAEALREIEKLPPGIRKAPAVQLLQARAHLGAGHLATAAEVARGLLVGSPDDASYLTLLGDVERAGKRVDQALKLYRRAREVSARDLMPVVAEVDLLRAEGNDLRLALSVLDAYKQKYGEDPLLLNLEASMLLDGGKALQARKTVQRSLLIDPNFWQSRYLLARTLLASGEDDSKVVVALEGAIKLGPLQPEPYNVLAGIYRKKGELGKAEETYRRLLDQFPDEPTCANNLANIYLEQGKAKEALDLAWTAYVGASKNPDILDTVGWALHLLGRHKEAEHFLSEAMAKRPNQPAVLLHWAMNLRARQKVGESDEVLKRLINLAPQTSEAARASQILKGAPS